MSEIRTSDLTGPSQETALRGLRKRAVVASGIGFFTDAYDLFVIGIVSTLLKGQWHLDTGQLALLNAVMLGAAFLAGIATGVWSSRAELAATWQLDRRFKAGPRDDAAHQRWRSAVERTKSWA